MKFVYFGRAGAVFRGGERSPLSAGWGCAAIVWADGTAAGVRTGSARAGSDDTPLKSGRDEYRFNNCGTL